MTKKKTKHKSAFKKNFIKKLFEIHKKRSIRKRRLIIGISTVVVVVLGFVGYSLWQNINADAGSSAGRGWTTVGSFNDSSLTGNVVACKTAVPKRGYTVKSQATITKVVRASTSGFKFFTSIGVGSSSGASSSGVAIAAGKVATASYSYVQLGTKVTFYAGSGDNNRGAIIFNKAIVSTSLANC